MIEGDVLTTPESEVLRVDNIFASRIGLAEGVNETLQRNDTPGHLDLVAIRECTNGSEEAEQRCEAIDFEAFHERELLDPRKCSWTSLVSAADFGLDVFDHLVLGKVYLLRTRSFSVAVGHDHA